MTLVSFAEPIGRAGARYDGFRVDTRVAGLGTANSCHQHAGHTATTGSPHFPPTQWGTPSMHGRTRKSRSVSALHGMAV